MGASTTVAEVSSNPQVAVCDDKPDAYSLVDRIFHQLSDDEKEQAARASSYRYLVASISSSPTEEGLDQRDRYAKTMIERYVTVEQKLNKRISPDAWEAAATLKLKRTLEYREEKQVDDIRLCFDKDKQSVDDGLHATLRERLTNRFASRATIIRGYTKDGRAMFQNFARNDTSWDEEYFTKGNIYMFERALACTERQTNGGKDKVVIFYDYNGYGLKNSPPPLLLKHLMSEFRDHWPERLQHVFMVDTPFFFRAFWAIVKHFIDPITKDLVQFITGEEQKKIFREMISEDQAAPFMFDGGRDGKEADMMTFFRDTPFDQVYGEERS